MQRYGVVVVVGGWCYGSYHVRHFDIADLLEADRVVTRVGTAGAAEVLIHAVSHCHRAPNVLGIGAVREVNPNTRLQ